MGRVCGQKKKCTRNGPLIVGSVHNFIFFKEEFFWFSLSGWFGLGGGSARPPPFLGAKCSGSIVFQGPLLHPCPPPPQAHEPKRMSLSHPCVHRHTDSDNSSSSEELSALCRSLGGSRDSVDVTDVTSESESESDDAAEAVRDRKAAPGCCGLLVPEEDPAACDVCVAAAAPVVRACHAPADAVLSTPSKAHWVPGEEQGVLHRH